MTLRWPIVVLITLVVGGAAFGGGYWLGRDQGRAQGFDTGVRYGEVQAAKKGPLPVRNRKHPLSALQGSDSWKALPVTDAEASGLAAIANAAISPCRSGTKRGVSLATSLLEPEESCPIVGAQLRLGLAALRTFSVQMSPEEAIEEAVAVLRVERRRPVPETGDRPVRGNPDAAVTLTVFSDFQCPYCVRGEKLVGDYLAENPDVRVVMRHLPLTRIHPAAWPAAVAAEAAAEQGRFWEMHDALFAVGPKKLGKGIDNDDPIPATGAVPFEALAEELGLDLERFRSDMRSLDVQERVQADMDLASDMGVGGTPAFFFDGREVRERRSPQVFAQLRAKAAAEADWRFSWGLEPPPRGATAPEGLAPDADPAQ